MKDEQAYWDNRYDEGATGWDLGTVSPPLKEYFDQLTSKDIAILIPGAGNAYEAAYLHDNGFSNITVVDISEKPLNNFKKNHPTFPSENLIHQDFFKHKGEYDLIIEQTFFCSFHPSRMNRVKYATKMLSLLKPDGKLVGLWFNIPLDDTTDKRPYGGTKKEYLSYFAPSFEVLTFKPAHNSYIEREGKEFFGILKKRNIKKQQNNPLHGITLKHILEHLVAVYGWERMDQEVRINCFAINPAIKSSLRFLRKTPWAREKVERLYLKSLKEK